MSVLTLPIHVSQPINPVLGTTFFSHNLAPQVIQELGQLGLYYLVDVTWPGALRCLSTEAQKAVRELLEKFGQPKLHLDQGDLPEAQAMLGHGLPWVVIQQHSLHGPLERKLRELAGVYGKTVIGLPTPLALALLPRMSMQPTMHYQLDNLLNRFGLHRQVTLDKVFVHQAPPALTSGQAMILSTSVFSMGLDEETLMWVCERTPPVPQAIDALVAILAVTDAPKQLREWFTHRGLPTNCLTADDLLLAMRTAHTEG
ncbi:TPA: hypothetical protein DEP96_02815 [Candidatus Uhrbacteria bacterium]|nr:hypothetical protein [Candidatus Uhrbacteria bacterium]